jgi:hypothetical protein
MAKATTTTATQTNETQLDNAPKAKAWSWSDEFDTDVAPPAAPPSRSTELPFKPLFSQMLPHALEGKKPSKAVPLSFFVERSTKPEAMNLGKAQGKVRDQFNKWHDKLPDDQKEVLVLSIVQKSGKEQDARIKEPHVVFWVLTSKPYVKPAEIEQENAGETEGQTSEAA